ncbi:MAG: dihydropteroate synthase [Opitutae bacterium]|nr:dihydropteroate synthase [Opitutae bacterium]
MGILNVTPDSFSDGGRHLEVAKAVDRVWQMLEEGAQFIDVGGESTRPGSDSVSVDEELRRIMPVIEALPSDECVISIDTTKPDVARAALEAGAHVVNDVSSGSDTTLFDLAERHQAGYVLMHAQGLPKTMQNAPAYDDVTGEVLAFFKGQAKRLADKKLPKVWMDPGIGFGKALDHNLALIQNLDALCDDRWGILIGASRKSWIDHLCGAPNPKDRLGGSLAAAIESARKGAEVIRVHNVRETVQALEVINTLNGPFS